MITLRILGMMTGTSCDGIDAACIEADSSGWRPLWTASGPYPAPLRKRVLASQVPGVRLPLVEWRALDRDLGDFYASFATRSLRQRSRRRDELPQVIANHGQTVGHFPSPGNKGTTAQLGDPTRIAVATGLTVVSRFREGDMAAGGQGAPLAPIFHRILAHHLSEDGCGVAIHNIGGISNLTYLGPNGMILAFDTGPGNAWIDAATQKATKGRLAYDKNGRLGLRGSVDADGALSILDHAFFSKKPPKSTGRDEFPSRIFFSATRARGADLVATATAITTESIVLAYQRWVLAKGLPLHSIFICGGGARNPALVGGLRERLPGIEVLTLDEAGLDPQYIEAQAFAMLGFLSLLGAPLGGAWTGARGFGPPGQITAGRNWSEVLRAMAEVSAT